MNIAIIDYDAGNIGSVKYALELCNFKCYIATEGKELSPATHIILPGVGSFAQAMKILHERNFVAHLQHAVLEKKIPILGICLGMQLFATTGYENGTSSGLNFIAGDVKTLVATETKLRLPHVGWNEVVYSSPNFLFNNIPNNTDFYFLHSFHFACHTTKNILSLTPYGSTFVSSVYSNNIVGVQFHPEKSGKLGKQLLNNFVLNWN